MIRIVCCLVMLWFGTISSFQFGQKSRIINFKQIHDLTGINKAQATKPWMKHDAISSRTRSFTKLHAKQGFSSDITMYEKSDAFPQEDDSLILRLSDKYGWMLKYLYDENVQTVLWGLALTGGYLMHDSVVPIVNRVFKTNLSLWNKEKKVFSPDELGIYAKAAKREEGGLKVFECNNCGTQFRPALGRANVIMSRPQFKCFRCGSKADEFFDIADLSDPRALERLERIEKEKNGLGMIDGDEDNGENDSELV